MKFIDVPAPFSGHIKSHHLIITGLSWKKKLMGLFFNFINDYRFRKMANNRDNDSWYRKCFDWWIRTIDPKFDGTTFRTTLSDGTQRSFNISHNPPQSYWREVLKKYEEAKKYDETIDFSIAFCIAYHNWLTKTETVKPVFGFSIQLNFPVPENVQRFFLTLS